MAKVLSALDFKRPKVLPGGQHIVHYFLAIVPIVDLRVAIVVREVPRQQFHAHGAFDQAAPNVWALPCLRPTGV